MQRQNIINLEGGLNIIEITIDDLGFESSKVPIAILPKGYKIKNMTIQSIDPFKSNLTANQTNEDSCIKARFQLGDTSNSELFLGKVVDTPIGTVCSNTGSYFSNPSLFSSDKKIYLDTWIIPRIWTVGPSISLQRLEHGGCGTTEASLIFCGDTTGSAGNTNTSEEFNGTSWSGGGNLSVSKRRVSSSGTQTAGLCAGSDAYVTTTELYNGSSWSTSGAMNVARGQARAFGVTTATVIASGYTSGSVFTGTVELFNGSTWSQLNQINIPRRSFAACGTATAGVVVNGSDSGGTTNIAEKWNGTTWIISNSCNIAIANYGAFGTQNAASVATSIYAEEYDGLTWRNTNLRNEAIRYIEGAGSQSDGMQTGGYENSTVYKTTEFYGDVNTSQVTPSGALTLNITIA